MPLNPEWKKYNDLYNEGGEGYNPHEKWVNKPKQTINKYDGILNNLVKAPPNNNVERLGKVLYDYNELINRLPRLTNEIAIKQTKKDIEARKAILLENGIIKPEKIKPEFRVIEIPDDLEYWTLKPEHKPYIKSINTVYLQETTTAWYLCTSTPGFCAKPLYTTIDFHNDPSDDIQEAIHDYVEEAYYETDHEYVYFTHISDSIKSVPVSINDSDMEDYENEEDRDLAIDNLWNAMIEDCQCNHRI